MSTVTTQKRTAPVKPTHLKKRKSKRKPKREYREKDDQLTAEEFFSYYTLLAAIFLLSMIICISMLAGGVPI
ncbi:MAG: hypothetical protein ACFFER_00575 [Candidatus Thorarchaeota archaeon]